MRGRTPASATELALLEAIRDEVLARLRGEGVSLGWLSDRTGVPSHRCSQWLVTLGATRYKTGGFWRIPQVTRGQRSDFCSARVREVH